MEIYSNVNEEHRRSFRLSCNNKDVNEIFKRYGLDTYSEATFLMVQEINQARIKTGKHREGVAFLIDDEKFSHIRMAIFMEQEIALVKATKVELEAAKKEIEDLVNQAQALHDNLLPKMTKIVDGVRSKRMAVTLELKEVLRVASDVRKFFLDKEHTVEMERVERFIEDCKRFRALQTDGTLDVMIDAILKLAIGGSKNDSVKG